MKTLDEQLAAYGRFIDEQLDAVEGGGHTARAGPSARFGRRALVLAAALVAAVLAVGGVVLVSRDDGSTNLAAGLRAPLVLLPADAEGDVVSDAVRRPYLPGQIAVFGRADADPNRLVHIEAFVPAGSVHLGFEGPTEQVQINGSVGTLGRLPGGEPMLQWDRGDATFLLTGGDAVDDETVVRIAAGAELESGSLTASWLPDGWRQLWDSNSGVGAITETSYRLVGDPTYTVTVWTGAPPGAELGIRFPGAGARVPVRGASGYLSGAPDNLFLAWREAPDTVVLVQQSTDLGIGVDGITAFAEALQRADDEWDAIRRDAASSGDAVVATSTTTARPRCCRAETLGAAGTVWPARPAAYSSALEVAEGFIHWATNSAPDTIAADEATSAGPTWVSATLAGGATVQILAVPAGDDGWRIVQVGDNPRMFYSAEDDAIRFTVPQGAATGTLSYRTARGAGSIDIEQGLDEGIVQLPGQEHPETVVLVIRATDGRVLDIAGGSF